MGRFISEDSVWGKDTDPLSLNLYTYCENDPVNQIDPSGHEGLPYEPNKTNKNPAILNTTNCYAYSMNLKCYPDGTPFDSHKYLLNINIWGHGIRIENGGINPGEVAYHQAEAEFNRINDSLKFKNATELTAVERANLKNALKNFQNTPVLDTDSYSNILECVKADADTMGLKFKIASKDEACPDDMYRICVAWTSGGKDYHFMHQNADGSWSSKPGGAPVKWDGNNPEKATKKENFAYFFIGNPSSYPGHKLPFSLQ